MLGPGDGTKCGQACFRVSTPDGRLCLGADGPMDGLLGTELSRSRLTEIRCAVR